MAKKKSLTTFGDHLKSANANALALRKGRDENQFIATLIWDGFTAAFKIALHHEWYDEFTQDLATVFAYREVYESLPTKSDFWRKWPVELTVFGMYQHSGSSAMGVAVRFIQSIEDTAKASRVAALNTFNSSHLDPGKMIQWANTMGKELYGTTLCLAAWPAGVMRRDYGVLANKANFELRSVLQHCDEPIVPHAEHARVEPTTPQLPVPKERFITVPMLNRILKDRLKLDTGITKLEINARSLRRWANKWTCIASQASPKKYSWKEVRLYFIQEHDIDIGGPPKMTSPKTKIKQRD